MANEIDLSWHFAVPLYQVTLGEYAEHKQGLIEHIHQLKQQDKGVKRSNHGGWHSADTLQQDTNSSVRWLMQQMLQFANTCAANFDQQGNSNKTFAISSSWVNINEQGDWNAPHQHLPAQWSGVFYAHVENDQKFEQGEGALMFLDPLPLGPEYNRGLTVNLKPSEGLLLLFPSYLNHMVSPHNGEGERISIAFNGRMVDQ